MTTYDRAAATDDGDLNPLELAEICEALISAWHEDSAQSGGGAAPDSASALDALAIVQAFPENRPKNFEHAHGQMAGHLVNAIVLQLRSVVTLLRAEPMIPLGVWPLVRSELEYAGRVAWLLEPLSGDGAGTRRAAREMLEHLASIQRQRFTAGKWDKARAKQFKGKRDELLARVQALFDDVDTPLDNPQQIDEWRIGGEPMLPLGKSIGLFLELHMTGAAALYDVLSDNTHPSVISLAFQTTTRDEDGITSTDFPAIPRVINFQVRLGCLFAYNAALLILRYFGYSSPAIDRWAAAAPARWFSRS